MVHRLKTTRNTRNCANKAWAKRRQPESQTLRALKQAKRGGAATKYEDRTKDELYQQAKELGIQGRSGLTKAELIEKLRNR